MHSIIVIDPVARTVTAKQVADIYAGLKAEIDDTFTVATTLADGDVLFVDDNGLLKTGQSFFSLPVYPNPLAGVGVITGPDQWDTVEKDYTSTGAQVSADEIRSQITWISSEEFRSWAANAGPAVSFTSFDEDGAAHTEVLSDFKDMPAAMEPE